jgi:RNA polymerase sigma-70 factor (ECF subfamily)
LVIPEGALNRQRGPSVSTQGALYCGGGQRVTKIVSSNFAETTPLGADSARAADLRLVARCTRGEPGAFEELYRRHAGRLFSLAARMLGNPADAEDLLQEIFLLAHRKLDSFKGDSALSTWLYRLGVNQCLDYLRSKAGRSSQRTQSLDDEESTMTAVSPPAGVEVAVTRIDLERAIARLPEGCRAAFVLHDIEGLEHREVAEVLGVAEGTSKSQVHKARLRLRALLASERSE